MEAERMFFFISTSSLRQGCFFSSVLVAYGSTVGLSAKHQKSFFLTWP